MKLYIENNTSNIDTIITEELLHEYVNSNYDYDLTSLFLEILTKKAPIKLDSEYINDANGFDEATEENIRKYADDPTFEELKDDMFNFALDICKEIEKLPDVVSTTVKASKAVGLSTYITVHFRIPDRGNPYVQQGLKDDPKFIGHFKSGYGDGHGYEGEYTLKFRLSNHAVKRATDADKEIDILGKTYDKFKDEIINICERHAQKLDNYIRNFAKTKKIPDKQRQRNLDRRERDALYYNHIREAINTLKKSHIIKESYSTEALMGRLDYDVQSLIHRYYINTEDIIDAIQVYFRELPIVFADLVDIAASCINSNIHNYILDTGNFDLQAFLNDMETIIITEYPEYFI